MQKNRLLNDKWIVTNLSVKELKSLLSFAESVAIGAGRVTLAYFQEEIEFDRKKDDTPVTIADKMAEEYVRARIQNEFPTHSILGEEEGESQGESSYRWIIDPIDGTTNFSLGLHIFRPWILP